MRIEHIKEKLGDLCSNYIVNGTVFNGLFGLFKSIKGKMLKNKMLSIVKRMKKLKRLANSLDNRVLNIIENKLKSSNLTEDEYLEHIYVLFNENMSDINKWKDKKREIELKKLDGTLTQGEIESLLILNKSIKLANNVNKDLMSLFIEITKNKQYSTCEYCSDELKIDNKYLDNKNITNKGLQLTH